MKQFLVMLAVLPLMMVFLLQFSLEQQKSVRLAAASDIVYAAREEAKQEGGFSPQLQRKLKSQLAERLGVSEDEVIIEASELEVYRVGEDLSRGIISYSVTVPAGRVMAAGSMFGINDEENSYNFTIRSITASEKLSPR